MEIKRFFKYFIERGALLYTVLSTLIMLISLLLTESSAVSLLEPKRFLFLLGFSYIMSLGTAFMNKTDISRPVSRLLHAICYNIGFFVFILLCGLSFSTSCIMTAIFAVIYTLYTVLSALLSKKLKITSRTDKTDSKIRKSEENSKISSAKKETKKQDTYTNMFS